MACLTWVGAAIAGEAAIPTHDFFDHPAYEDVKISPTGKYLAATVKFEEEGETRLGIIDRDSMKVTAMFRVEGPGGTQRVGDFFWVNDHRVVFDTLIKLGNFDIPFWLGYLYGGNADGKEFFEFHGNVTHRMSGQTENVPYRFMNHLPLNDETILVRVANQYSGGSFYRWAAYRLNVNSRAKVQLAQDPLPNGAMLADHKGQVRFVTGFDRADWVVMTHDNNLADWREVQRIKNVAHGHIVPLAVSPDDTQAYVWSDIGTPTGGIYAFDLATGKQSLLFRPDGFDAEHLVFARDMRTPIGVTFGPKRAVHYFDPASPEAKLRLALEKAFAGSRVGITSFTSDARQGVVWVSSDRDPGQFYLVDVSTFKISPLISLRPWIKPERMNEMQPIALKARDGLELHGYLTVPAGVKPKNLPMIVVVHGGPHGVQDTWSFDSEAQFLSHHGYAVLQVNYRGSAGYGHDFQAAGYRRWGREMQDDVTDATRWAVTQGIADKDRICIYGASYGGYSALMGVEREPDLYRCAVGYAGVYDLEYMHDRGDIIETIEGIDYLEDVLGHDKKDLRERSPVYNVDKIKVPLFLAHGGKDQRAPIGQYERLASALKAAGKPFETLLKDNEMHGFYDEANNVELYDKMLDFFNRNTGPRAQQ